ncbi:SDR family NAD(P)-dependent oxidoreductase [Parahaliea aestuarii]|uniref:SDR family NAD(P)-dependent oxidoreductase n=1 Tax=Parahaliea aestuarii TaxID=1852021 RepID=A0A5C8ZP37_9GAMM|nr:SDR family NAD(P)-dependent oxidoreductase [Parahaliea aestuarii]TXS89131.1 SDR family NAD(P)-dependent oxidoreductase [Parahaliea aestuarii]
MADFGFASTTDEVLAGIDLSGQLAMVTGASSGLGMETARALAARGATVVLLARDRAKLDAALAGLEQQDLPGQLDSALLDLSDLDKVRNSAATLLDLYPRVDLLINNAGVMACPLQRTAQGFEMQFGTNHLGHFLFTCLMAPALQASAAAGGEPRVVNLSSAGHRFGAFDFDDPNYRQRDYEKWQAYGESKTANVLFSVGLDTRLAPHGVRVFAVHPGMIMTELGRHLDAADMEAIRARATSVSGGKPAAAEKPRSLFKTIPQGAATSAYAATAPALAGQGGRYLEDCQLAEVASQGGAGGVESYATDPELAERLWRLSEELVGEAFSFG